MRAPRVAVCLIGCCLLTGCWSQRRRPYEHNPLLLHYKPTLSDSATILAEKQVRRGPIKPPMPLVGRDAIRDDHDAATLQRLDVLQPVDSKRPAKD